MVAFSRLLAQSSFPDGNFRRLVKTFSVKCAYWKSDSHLPKKLALFASIRKQSGIVIGFKSF